MAYPLGIVGFITLTYFVIVGTSNAVNLTDGLDGLAIMPTVMIAAAFALIAYVTGHAVYAKYLLIPYVPGGRRAVHLPRRHRRGRAWLPVVQRLSGEVFMGDVGALALGAALGTVAVIVRQEIVLADHGRRIRRRNPVGDAQVGWFKYTGNTARAAHLPHGAAAPPLRTNRLEGDAGRRPLLDHHHHARADRALYLEAALHGTQGQTRSGLGLGESGLAMAKWLASPGRARARRRQPTCRRTQSNAARVAAGCRTDRRAV
jgi:hypothetical protein